MMKFSQILLRVLLIIGLLSGWALAAPAVDPGTTPVAFAEDDDDDDEGFQVQPTEGLITTEAGGTATFTIRLTSEPDDPVRIRFTSSDPSEGTVEPGQVTFDEDNWSNPRTVTITGVDDNIPDGDVQYTINTHPAESEDDDYDGLNPPDVHATNQDDDFGPDANDDSDITNMNTPVTTAVLANDTGLENNPLTVLVVEQPANGSVQVESDLGITYTPAPNFFGTDTYRYQVCDAANLCDSALVTITVLNTNSPPVANNDSAATVQDTPVEINVLTNDSDPNGDPLTVVSLTQPSNGQAEILNGGLVRYTPSTGFTGEDSFNYTISDGRGETDSATVRINVYAPQQTVVATGDSYTTPNDTVLNVAAPGVLGNDSTSGQLSLQAVRVDGPAHGTLDLRSDGSFTYTPNPGFVGEDLFRYRAVAGTVQSESVRVDIEVVDTQAPTVIWVRPVVNERRYDVGMEMILLEVEANDNHEVAYVNFFRWDAANTNYVDMGNVSQAPYTLSLDSAELNPGWNQVFVRAVDRSCNISGREYIWIFLNASGSVQLFLPVLMR